MKALYLIYSQHANVSVLQEELREYHAAAKARLQANPDLLRSKRAAVIKKMQKERVCVNATEKITFLWQTTGSAKRENRLLKVPSNSTL